MKNSNSNTTKMAQTKIQTSNRTSQLIPTLIADIIFQILLKLPVESLLRCKSVCKKWYSLISDHHFITTHYTLSNSNNINYAHHRLVYLTSEPINNLKVCPLSNLMFDKSTNNALLLENPLQRTRPPRDLSIAGSCNGLMCLYADDSYHIDLFIYNPSTRIWNGLPSRKNGDRNSYSFGYDESTDDFKIVELGEILYDIDPPYTVMQIYSLKTGKWKNIDDFPYHNPLVKTGIFSNGALHWVTGNGNDDSPKTKRIVSFDLAKETYGEVYLFEYDEGATELITLGVLGECLCGLCCYYSRHADLWVMKVYGVKESWTKLVSFPYLMDGYNEEYPVPLFVSNDGKVLLDGDPELVIYESKESSYELIDRSCGACVVVESLISPFSPLALADYNEN